MRGNDDLVPRRLIEHDGLGIGTHFFPNLLTPSWAGTPSRPLPRCGCRRLAAGIVLAAALARSGHARVSRLAADRERNPWTLAARERIEQHRPGVLFVLDLGSRAERIVPSVPTCLLDHHRPDGCPLGATLISAYGWEPTPTTSLLVHEVAGGLADLQDLEWVTAVGILSDLGEKAPFELLMRAKKRYTAKWLREVTTLVNAARRASRFDPEAAARAPLNHASPRDLAADDADVDVRALKAAREEVQAALGEAKKKAPVFAGGAALVRVNSPCQIHPLLAQVWRTRLPRYVVIVANEGYLARRVNFAARSTTSPSALEFLRSFSLTEGEGTYGQGHDHASGGSLPVARWNELLDRMGFPSCLHVSESSPGGGQT
jgi:single-stranded-DNA-specific exonuclease